MVLRGILALVRITGRVLWMLRWVLALFRVPGRVLRILRVWLRLLRLVLRLRGWNACMQENCMAGVAILAVGCVGGMTGVAVGDKRISAVGAHPLSPQVLCAALRAGSC